MAAFRANILCLLLTAALPALAAAEEKPSPSEILRAVVASRDVPLTAENSCAAASPVPGAKNIGDYFSDLVSALADEQFRDMKLRVESAPVKTGKEVYWDCSVMFEVKDGKSPWSYGIAFHLDDKTRKANPKSFRCPGCC